jgi:hypothetical protein
MSVLNKPFESKYGFQSTGFSVDASGNITANALTLAVNVSSSTPANYTITKSNNFSYLGIPSNIVLSRSTTYIFDLNLGTAHFAIFTDTNSNDLFSIGVSHSDGSFGINAQNKSTGRIFFTVPTSAPDILYFSDGINNDIAAITCNIVNPAGVFNTLVVSDLATFNADVDITGSLDISGLVTVDEITGTDVTINPSNEIILSVNDGVIGTISSTGLELTNITVEAGSITDAPTVNEHITNKQYVDTRSTALAIALGS